MEINTKQDFFEAIMKYDIPDSILLDVKSRMLDWILMGGNFEEDYIKQQYKYIERYINMKCIGSEEK